MKTKKQRNMEQKGTCKPVTISCQPASNASNDTSSDMIEFKQSKNDERIVKMKQSLNIDAKIMENAWERLEKKLNVELKEIQELNSEIIPEVSFDKISENDGEIPPDVAAEVHKRGVLIVRSVLSQEEAINYLCQLTDYMEANNEDPKKIGKTFFEVYWSKAQVNARQHTNMIATQKALLHLWKKDGDAHKTNKECKDNTGKMSENNINECLDDSVNLDQPLAYIDRMRFRKPGDNSLCLPPHMDSGSITRWSDPIYRNAYEKIFAGHWEDYDPFKIGGRGVCTMDRHCSFFRAFQGWTSLSEAGPGEGTLRVLPLTKESTAFLMMRPFLKDIADEELPGYEEGKLFFLHPSIHSKLYSALVSIPKVFPGDTVWWHPDLVHSVETAHNGKETNTVLYIPVGPDCPINRLYVERMRFQFLSGLSPPDFESKPENEKQFKDRATLSDLSSDGQTMMGFSKK